MPGDTPGEPPEAGAPRPSAPGRDEQPPLDLRPSRRAFVLAYAAVVVAGLLGAGIGAGLADVSCSGSCAGPVATGAVVGALVAAAGVAVIAVLVLRAMAEWNTQRARELREAADRAAGSPES